MNKIDLELKRLSLSAQYNESHAKLKAMHEQFIASISWNAFRFYHAGKTLWYCRTETSFKAITRSKKLFKLYLEAKALNASLISLGAELDRIHAQLQYLNGESHLRLILGVA